MSHFTFGANSLPSDTRHADCGGGPGTKQAGPVKTTMNAPFGKRVGKRGGGKR